MSIRLILADDHPIVLQGLQRLFEREPDFDIVRCCAGGAETIEAVRTSRPDVLVVDLRMADVSGFDVLRSLASEQIDCRSVILTAAMRDGEVAEAIQLGARGIVLKESSPETLVDCVRRVHRGEQWMDQKTVTRALDQIVRRDPAPGPPPSTLTRRELEVVRLVAEGLRNRVVAERLGISEGTVKVHLNNIYDKLGVDGRLELVLCAQQKGLL